MRTRADSSQPPDEMIRSMISPTPFAMSVAEATIYCGLSRATLYRLIKSGAIRPRKCGNRTLILVSELERFLRDLPVGSGEDRSGTH